MCRYCLLALALLVIAPALAQEPSPGSCELGRARADLNVSDVTVRLFNTGSIIYGDGLGAAYLVPRMSGRSPMFAAGIWVGGMIDSDLRVAGSTYDNYEFWPGPLDPITGRPPDPDDCSPYDRIFVVSVRDVEEYDSSGVATRDLADWPVALGAEVVDGDGVPGNYDLAAGDRPRIYGTQTAFWVMNDMGNAHQNSLTPPIGLEVRVHAFAVVDAAPALHRATFYRYTLVNRNTLPLHDTFFSVFADPDLGDAADDYVGADYSRALGYVYNSDNTDGDGSPPSYGTPPPSAGFDMLSDSLGAFMYFTNGALPPQRDPANGHEVYEVQRGRWTDGTPMTAGGTGLNPGSTDTTRFAFTGNPVTGSFWSERCPFEISCGAPNLTGDRRMVLSAPPFILAPGETRTFDVALLYGGGSSYLASITSLRQASDVVQSRHANGTLFNTVAPLATLPAPTPLSPSDDEYVGPSPATLTWEAVPGAEGYVVQIWPVADSTGRALAPSDGVTLSAGAESVQVPSCGVPNHVARCAWRVRADAPSMGAVGLSSPTRTFRLQEFVAGLLDGAGSVIETANPGMSPCPDPGDFGCETYAGEGNSAFHDPNRTGDYDLSSTTGLAEGLLNTVPGSQEGLARTASPDDYEIRFTAAGGYAVYNAFLGAASPKQIVHVPFEVWNVGTTPADPGDDVRMIPVLRQNTSALPLLASWADVFPTVETRIVDGDPVFVPVTEQLNALFPDRPNGYDLFEAAAVAFGGAGATYDPGQDGDSQVDLNPTNGQPCSRQSFYTAFCARNDRLIPAGGNTALSAGFVQLLFADIAMDGTTPPAGTVVRLKMARYPAVANEPPAQAGDAGVVIESVTPNPVTGAARIVYSLPSAGPARVVVYDVLGRAVAVLSDGPAPAGRGETALRAGVLSPGVYVIVVDAGAGRAARTFTVSR